MCTQIVDVCRLGHFKIVETLHVGSPWVNLGTPMRHRYEFLSTFEFIWVPFGEPLWHNGEHFFKPGPNILRGLRVFEYPPTS